MATDDDGLFERRNFSAHGLDPYVRYFDPQGNEISLAQWQQLLEERHKDMSPESWWRKHTEISEELRVSTVWLGLNHNYFMEGPPLFWETMVFGCENEYQWRYSSRQEAFDDHERIVRELRAGREPE
jgi:hypothetical protein